MQRASDDLLSYLITQAQTGAKNWFGYPQQRLINISLCHQIAANHADCMSPDEVVDYVLKLNDQIFKRIVTNGQT
jgi:hypothetical protein